MTINQERLLTAIDSFNYHRKSCRQCIKQIKGDTRSLQNLCLRGVEMFREISLLKKKTG